MLSKPSKKGPSQSLCIGRSSSREYQTDPEKQAENSVFEFFNRIGHNRPVSLSQPRSFERQLYSENCRMPYFGTSANPVIGGRSNVRPVSSRLLTLAA